MSGGSWTHLAVRPMIGTTIWPNHLTTLRLLFGLGACLCLASGSRTANLWDGGLWIVSALLDRADGELARLGGLSSPAGHLYDYYVDNLVNALFFVCAGIGLRHGWLGGWAPSWAWSPARRCSACGMISERLEQVSPTGTRAYSGRWGFDPDDALYLMGPFAWLGWLGPILVGAAIGATTMMTLTGIRLARLKRRLART